MTSIISLNGTQTYGTVVRLGLGFRVQVRAEEWSSIGLEEGQTVTVRLPGEGERKLLLSSVVEPPGTGTVWAGFVAPVAARRRAEAVPWEA